MSKKIVMYTAITGDKDVLLPIIPRDDCDFVCFTDNKNLVSSGWEIRVIEPFHPNPRLSAKPFKILPHYYFPNYKYSIWMDGTFAPKDDLVITDFINKFLNNTPIAVYTHVNSLVIPTTSMYYRDCIYEEAEVCLLHNLDAQMKIIKQVLAYRDFMYPTHFGLNACSIILREHNKPVLASALDDWWKEVTLRSIRDQISFRYVMYKHRIALGDVDGNVYHSNPYFIYTPHKKLDAHNNKPNYHKWIQYIRKAARDGKNDLISICFNWISNYNKEIPLDDWYTSGITSEDAYKLLLERGTI